MASIFGYTILFFVALFAWAYTNFWLAVLMFAGGVAVISNAQKKAMNDQFDEAQRIIDAHAQELSIRRRQLTAKLNYGIVDDKKWQREIELFVSQVIEPKTGRIDVLGKNYERVRQAITVVTADYEATTVAFSGDISPIEYEQLVANVLRSHGWEVRLTAATGDQGIDVVAIKNKLKAVIQCKLYAKPVGNAAVQEAIAGRAFEQANFAAVVSNASFTRSARQLASSSGVFLLHHDQLGELENMCVLEAGNLISAVHKNG
jgi:restriction system protein